MADITGTARPPIRVHAPLADRGEIAGLAFGGRPCPLLQVFVGRGLHKWLNTLALALALVLVLALALALAGSKGGRQSGTALCQRRGIRLGREAWADVLIVHVAAAGVDPCAV